MDSPAGRGPVPGADRGPAWCHRTGSPRRPEKQLPASPALGPLRSSTAQLRPGPHPPAAGPAARTGQLSLL